MSQDRASVEHRRHLDELRDEAEARLMGKPAPALTQVEGEEPMVCDDREASHAVEYGRS